MGKGSTPSVQETQAEKQVAEQAQYRWNERKNDGYLALEQAQIADSGRDVTQVLQGQSSADIAQAERAAYAGAPPTERDLTATGNTISTALSHAQTDATTAAQKYKDTRRLGTIRTGNDMASETSATLGDLGAMASERATADVQNRVMLNNAKANAAMNVVGGAIQGYSMGSAGYKLGKDSTGRVGVLDKDGKNTGFGVFAKRLGA